MKTGITEANETSEMTDLLQDIGLRIGINSIIKMQSSHAPSIDVKMSGALL